MKYKNLISSFAILNWILFLFVVQSNNYLSLYAQSLPQAQDLSGTEADSIPILIGTVTNNEGDPLPGVSIKIKGTSKGTITDSDGKYELNDLPKNQVLVFSFVGMQQKEVLVGRNAIVNIKLEEIQKTLDDLVIVGYGSMRKADLTGAISLIKQESYINHPVNRLDQVIQGRTAGVNVTNMSGSPGGELTIRIRGPNSINFNNDPLFVIDGFIGADFRDISPEDVASIQILKDAAATAVFGNRGANGVIVITTKTGTVGKPNITVSSRLIHSRAIKKWDLLDVATYAEIANERFWVKDYDADNPKPPPFSDEQIEKLRKTGGTNWQDEVIRETYGEEYHINYSGMKDNTAYYVSGNFINMEGIMKNSYIKHYTVRSNIKSTISPKLTTDTRLNFSHRNTNNTFGSYSMSGPFGGILAWSPAVSVYNESGEYTAIDLSTIYTNPSEFVNNDRILVRNSVLGGTSFTYKIIKGLTAKANIGLNYVNAQNKFFTASVRNQDTQAFRDSQDQVFLQNMNLLNYTSRLGIFHRIDITGVVEHQMAKTEGFGVNVYGLYFPNEGIDIPSNANKTFASVTKQKETTQSFILRTNYSYKDKYLLSTSGRIDGSSKFRKKNRYAFFPSIGLGWRVTEEYFMQQQNIINHLKIRGSYGKVGSQDIPPFQTHTLYRTDQENAAFSHNNYDLSPGIIIGDQGNPNLKWESTRQFNIGIEALAINSQIELALDYFQKKTTDLLLVIPLPGYVGGQSIVENDGEVMNKGYEISLTVHSSNNEKFKWASNINASFLQNEVISIGDRSVIETDPNSGYDVTTQPEMIIKPGYSIATYYGLRYLGTWKSWQAEQAAYYGAKPGDSRYEDLNSDGDYTAEDYQPIGSAIPKTLLGWNTSFDYKRFSFNLFFQAVLGYEKMNFAYAIGMTDISDAKEYTHADILDRWVAGTNEDSDIPAISDSDETFIQSSRFLEKGDFLRLKNISLTYRLPNKLIDNMNGSIQISANNLWTLTKYNGLDPESFSVLTNSDSSRGIDAGAYPNAKSISVGIKLSF